MTAEDSDLNAGFAILMDQPVIRVLDFEDALKKRVRPTIRQQVTPLKRKKRTIWENRTDWVKANLTKHGVIRYFEYDGERYILFAMECGTVDGTDLIPLRTLHELITQFGLLTGVRFTT